MKTEQRVFFFFFLNISLVFQGVEASRLPPGGRAAGPLLLFSENRIPTVVLGSRYIHCSEPSGSSSPTPDALASRQRTAHVSISGSARPNLGFSWQNKASHGHISSLGRSRQATWANLWDDNRFWDDPDRHVRVSRHLSLSGSFFLWLAYGIFSSWNVLKHVLTPTKNSQLRKGLLPPGRHNRRLQYFKDLLKWRK